MEDVRPTTAAIALGNIWSMAALMAKRATESGELLLVVTIDDGGNMEAVGADHPEYESRLVSPGFVCTLSPATEHARLASRIRGAVEAACRA